MMQIFILYKSLMNSISFVYVIELDFFIIILWSDEKKKKKKNKTKQNHVRYYIFIYNMYTDYYPLFHDK